MKKALIVLIVVSMLCVSLTGIANSAVQIVNANEENVLNETFKTVKKQNFETIKTIRNTVDNYLKMDEDLYTPQETSYPAQSNPQPLLGGGEIFGLWMC